MSKINQLRLRVLLGLVRGVTAATFAALEFLHRIGAWVYKRNLLQSEPKKLKNLVINGLYRILAITILRLTAWLALALGCLHQLILGGIQTLFIGEND